MDRDLPFSRWWLVVAAAVAMGMAGSYQFVWSSIRIPLGTRLGASEAALGTVFTLFVTFQTVAQFPAGWVRDRWGPRGPLLAGAILIAAGYVATATATGIAGVYLAYAVGGIGSGIAYTVAVNTPVKWFTDRRGLATGAVTMAYGGTSFLLIPAVRRGVAFDFGRTMLALAALAGAAVLLAVPVLRDPPSLDPTGGDGAGGDGEAYTWRETVRTWQFWLLYGVFVVTNGVGLMVIGKVVAFAGALDLAAWAATASASLVALADAGGVVVGGGLSDLLGRERTVGAMLVGCGLALAAAVLAGAGGIALAFVALVGVAAFFRSPAFAVFPGIVGEYYGTAHSSENYALLYTAKVWGGAFGGAVASGLVVSIGWSSSFLLGAGLIAAAGVATFFVRPP